MNSVHSYGFVGEDLAVRMRERGSGIGSKTRKRMQMRPERSLKEEVCSPWHTV